jgi:N-acetylmuramoyl-L-alanine amidase
MNTFKNFKTLSLSTSLCYVLAILLFIVISSSTGCKNASSNYIQEFESQEQLDSLFDDMDHRDSLTEDSIMHLEELQDLKSGTTGQTLKRFVIHCTASNIKTPHTKETLLDFFKNTRHWSKPGYTFFIDRDGIIWKLNEHWDWDPLVNYSEITFGAAGYNSTSLHASWDGGVENNKIIDNRTDKQKQALLTLVQIVHDIYPNIEVLGHTDLEGVNKLCPIYDVKKEYADILATAH